MKSYAFISVFFSFFLQINYCFIGVPRVYIIFSRLKKCYDLNIYLSLSFLQFLYNPQEKKKEREKKTPPYPFFGVLGSVLGLLSMKGNKSFSKLPPLNSFRSL